MDKVTTEAFDALVAEAVNANITADDFDGPLFGSRLGLFTNTPALSKKSVLGDLTIPTYAGYALQVAIWTAPIRRPPNLIAMETQLTTWQMDDDVVPTTITGYFLQSATGTVLYWAVMFDTAIALTDALSAFGLVDRWNASNSNAGVADIIV